MGGKRERWDRETWHLKDRAKRGTQTETETKREVARESDKNKKKRKSGERDETHRPKERTGRQVG